MKPTEIKKSLSLCLRSKRPSFIWGSPGSAKSDIVRQVSKAEGYQLIDLRLTQLDQIDLRGLPKINGNGKTTWSIPDFWPTSGKWIIFLDEFNAAPPLMQATCYQLILDRRLGDYVMPDDCRIIACGNKESDKAVTHRMPTAMSNRFCHLTIDIDVEEWIAWSLQNGIETEIIAFIRFRPELLYQFDPKKNDKAFPTLRSWEFVSDFLKQKPEKDIEYELYSGIVGDGASAELTGFLRVFRDLPDPDSVILNPMKAVIPSDPATLYAICGALSRKAGDNTISPIIKYSNRLPAEYSVLLVRDAINFNPDVKSTRAFIDWSVKHQDVLI